MSVWFGLKYLGKGTSNEGITLYERNFVGGHYHEAEGMKGILES